LRKSLCGRLPGSPGSGRSSGLRFGFLIVIAHIPAIAHPVSGMESGEAHRR
jgi:hypothetical protein